MELIYYPFKQTTSINIIEIFKRHITNQHGCPEIFYAVEKVFQNIQKLREKLLFDKVDTNNLKQCEELEISIYQYLRYIRNLQKKFKFEGLEQNSVNIFFNWSDSFRKEKIMTTRSLRLEMCSILYNLAILLYYIGNQYLSQNSNEGRKKAIKKFNKALWAINTLNTNLPSIIRQFEELHLDFTVANIVSLEHTLYGLSYACLYHNLEPEEIQLGFQKIAGLSGEANKHFQCALKIIREMPVDQKSKFSQEFLLTNQNYLYSNTVYYFIISALKMAKYYEKQFQKKQKAGLIGMALSYLSIAKDKLTSVFKDGDILFPFIKQKIQKLKIEIEKKYQDLIYQNQNVKDPIADFNDLKPTHLMEEAILVARFPSDLLKDLSDEKQFLDLLSIECIQMLKQVKDEAELKKKEVKTSLQDLKERRSQEYQKHSVNGYLEILYQSIYLKKKKEYSQLKQIGNSQMMAEEEYILPHTIQQKINEIKKVGGEEQIRKLLLQLEQNFVPSSGLLKKGHLKLQKEEKEHEEYINQSGGLINIWMNQKEWKMLPSSQANVEYIKQIVDFEANLREARQYDYESQKTFDDLRQYFDLIKEGPKNILSLIPLGKDQKFTESYYEKIKELNEKDNQLVNLIKQVEEEVPNITKCLQDDDLAKQIGECWKVIPSQNEENRDSTQAQVNKQEKILDSTKAFQKIISSPLKICDNIFKGITKANPIIDAICGTAQFLNQQKMKLQAKDSIEKIEEMNNGFGKILELYHELLEGIEFYSAFLGKVTELDTNISDFLMQRSLMRQFVQNSIQNLKSQGIAGGEGGNITPQPYFEDGGLPNGGSCIIKESSNFGDQISEIEKCFQLKQKQV